MSSLKKIFYNIAQLCFLLSKQKFKILEWGRGAGKSTIIARQIINCVTSLPRSTGILAAETYMQIKTRTLPSTIKGLEEHGYVKDVHYFVGRRPPTQWHWPEPYQPPLDYKNSIIFWNGAVINFVSQDGGGASGRGLNTDWVISDEACRLKYDWFQTDVLATNRGNLMQIAHYPDGSWRYFKDCELHHSVLIASTTPLTQEGKWFTDFENIAKANPEAFIFLKASAEVNQHNLGDEWFENQRKTMPDFLYRAEILNERIDQVPDGFYPLLKEGIHTYTSPNADRFVDYEEGDVINCLFDSDLDLEKPLYLGMDWGAKINCLVVAQRHNNEIRFIKNFYVKYPEIIDHLVVKFHEYYQEKQIHNPMIYMAYDPSGNNAVANSQMTYADQAKNLLKAKGWIVQTITRNNFNIPHQMKYTLWNNILKGTHPNLPRAQFNKSNCLELWISMTQAPAKQGTTEAIKKDKSSETKKHVLQEHATHFSDAADVLVVSLYLNDMTNVDQNMSVGTR